MTIQKGVNVHLFIQTHRVYTRTLELGNNLLQKVFIMCFSRVCSSAEFESSPRAVLGVPEKRKTSQMSLAT